ncbi:MAG: MerR family transcriptional regulator [Tannerella sp.]|jgi:DNA-binding transcriptional MerR regulator|nr:MerR family transcriptional regulator [Tannerella sp.]
MKKDVTVTKRYYSIKEVAFLLGESESTLRYWEKEFPDVISPRRNERDVRFYSKENVDNVALIQYLIRDCGFTLEGVRKRLKNDKGKESAANHAFILQCLKKIKAELEILEDALDEVEKKIRQKNAL